MTLSGSDGAVIGSSTYVLGNDGGRQTIRLSGDGQPTRIAEYELTDDRLRVLRVSGDADEVVVLERMP